MASTKTSCKVQFKNFKWKRSGYADLMNTSAVQALVKDQANKVYSRVATGDAQYVVVPVQGKLAKGYIVGTDNYYAMLSEAKHNTLAKAIGSL